MNKNSLMNKRVLLLATSFFGYEVKIYNEIKNQGAIVELYNERSINTNVEKALLKVIPNLFTYKTLKYYRCLIEKCRRNTYDYVFIYGATMINSGILDMLKTEIPSKYILYLADSVIDKEQYLSIIPKFDVVYTFDTDDYKKLNDMGYQVNHLPLFYSEEYMASNKSTSIKYDLCFIGTIHSDRWQFLSKIKEQAIKYDIKYFIYPYLPSKFMFYFYYLINPSFRNSKVTDFKYDKISSSDIRNYIESSRIVVDAQYPKNTGLTMRTIESLGMKKKLITTNQSITGYDFYNGSNILLVDRDEPILDSEFISSPYKEIPENIYQSYSLENWIKSIFK